MHGASEIGDEFRARVQVSRNMDLGKSGIWPPRPARRKNRTSTSRACAAERLLPDAPGSRTAVRSGGLEDPNFRLEPSGASKYDARGGI